MVCFCFGLWFFCGFGLDNGWILCRCCGLVDGFWVWLWFIWVWYWWGCFFLVVLVFLFLVWSICGKWWDMWFLVNWLIAWNCILVVGWLDGVVCYLCLAECCGWWVVWNFLGGCNSYLGFFYFGCSCCLWCWWLRCCMWLGWFLNGWSSFGNCDVGGFVVGWWWDC